MVFLNSRELGKELYREVSPKRPNSVIRKYVLGLAFLIAFAGAALSKEPRDYWNYFSKLNQSCYSNAMFYSQQETTARTSEERETARCSKEKYDELLNIVTNFLPELKRTTEAGFAAVPGETVARGDGVMARMCEGLKSIKEDCHNNSEIVANSLKALKCQEDRSVRNVQSTDGRIAVKSHSGSKKTVPSVRGKNENTSQKPVVDPRKCHDEQRSVQDSNQGRGYRALTDKFQIYYNGSALDVGVTISYPDTISIEHEWPVTVQMSIHNPQNTISPAFFNVGSINFAIDDAAGIFYEPLPMHFVNYHSREWEKPVREVEKSFLEDHGSDFIAGLVTELIPYSGVFSALDELSTTKTAFPEQFYNDTDYDVLSLPFIGVSLPFIQKQQLATSVEVTVPILWEKIPRHEVVVCLRSDIGNQPTETNNRPDMNETYYLLIRKGHVTARHVEEDLQ